MGTAGELIILIKYSPKWKKLLGDIKGQVEFEDKNIDPNADSISKLSETRWTVRSGYFKRILDNYNDLMAVWKHCIDNEKMATELRSRIIRVKKQMETFEFFFGLKLGHRLSSHTDKLSKALQAERMSAAVEDKLQSLF